MTHAVVFTAQADREIEGATDWWATRRSAEQAGRWYLGLSDAIVSLTTNPERLPLADEDVDFPYELRELDFGLGSRPTHRVLFTVVRDIVIVLTIRHAARGAVRPDDIESDPTSW